MALLLTLGRSLDALTLGEDAARTSASISRALRTLIVAGTALAVGAATAIAGTIGFVGLVVPHVLRPLVGHAAVAPAAGEPARAARRWCSPPISRCASSRPGGDLRLGVLTALHRRAVLPLAGPAGRARELAP